MKTTPTRPGSPVYQYIDALPTRAGVAHYATTLFHTDGYEWLKVGLATDDAEAIQKGVDVVYYGADAWPTLGARLLEDYQAWKVEQIAAVPS